MSTLLSIISVKSNSFSNEKLMVGLLAITADKVFFGYSENKIKLFSKLVNKDSIHGFIISVLNQISHSVQQTNKKLSKGQKEFFLNKVTFSEDYISYLSQYNNGLVQFSKPESLPFSFDKILFSDYFKKFVGQPLSPKKVKKPESLYVKIKPFLKKEGLQEKADINYTLKNKTFQDILQDVKIPLITKNGDIKTLQEMDFANQTQIITKNLYETKIVKEALTKFSKDIDLKVAKIKVVFEEPPLGTPQHKIFDLALKAYKNDFEFINPQEVDAFTDMILEKNYTQFSKLIS